MSDIDRARTSGSKVDDARSACLCQQGSPGYLAAVCVDPDGTDTLWLVYEPVLNHRDAPHGDLDQAGHERLGPLSAAVRERIWADTVLRCGRPRTNGQPCKCRVEEPGAACIFHADRTTPA